MTISAQRKHADVAYDADRISRSVEFVNLLSYDLEGSWAPLTGLHTALFPKQNEIDIRKELTVDWAVKYWLAKGIPREKLILGVAFYGRGFKLQDPSLNATGSPSIGPSASGKIIEEEGFLAYYEICDLVQSGAAVENFNEDQKVPSIQIGQDWIGYENERSLEIKSEYVKSMCLGGVMIWAVSSFLLASEAFEIKQLIEI